MVRTKDAENMDSPPTEANDPRLLLGNPQEAARDVMPAPFEESVDEVAKRVDPITNQDRASFATFAGDDADQKKSVEMQDRSLRGSFAARTAAADSMLLARQQQEEANRIAKERLEATPKPQDLSKGNVMIPPEMYRAQQINMVKAEAAELRSQPGIVGGVYLVGGRKVDAWGIDVDE
ncbi:MAG: hypothetical protein M3P94_06945 [Chloroflexota bacterium]|nr:hypothetical protein [Chloroflexota bacterium]